MPAPRDPNHPRKPLNDRLKEKVDLYSSITTSNARPKDKAVFGVFAAMALAFGPLALAGAPWWAYVTLSATTLIVVFVIKKT